MELRVGVEWSMGVCFRTIPFQGSFTIHGLYPYLDKLIL